MSTSATPSPPPALARGLPERYRLGRHLATGGMAAVWSAEDRVLRRQVAIKVLADRFANDEIAVRRFKREARAAARVSAHPHVVTIFDVGDLEAAGSAQAEPAGAFIVMEHLAGGTVADALRHHTVTPEETRRWLREAADALDHAHARGIVHRDIKPANFLLDQGRGLHVADFGIARLASEDTITSAGELFGTAAYLAPEQALGHDATPASDRYALAIAAFELLTGGRPFTAPHFAAQARQHIDEAPPRASERTPSLPPAVDHVLARGMAKDPEARYPSSVAFVSALEAALDGTATARTAPLARAVVAPDPVRAGARGHGRTLALLALLVAALGVVLVVAGLGGSGPSRPVTRAGAPSRHRPAAPVTSARHRPASSASASSSSTTVSATSSTTAAATASPSSTPTTPASSPTAAQLQILGHQELQNGNYLAAIAADRRAMNAADHASVTYAYALYDLGDALVRGGNPQAAIPVLQQRLQIPNQTATVKALLDQALRAAGQAPATPGSTGGVHLPPGPAKHHGHPGGGGD